jgi:hypothetical protein
MTGPNLRDRALQVGGEYNTLILRLSENTDAFLQALDQSGIESAGDLIESRLTFTTELVKHGETLKPLIQEIERSGADQGSELQDILADIHANLVALNEKQRFGEALLSGRMDQCRADLTTLEQHSGLRRTYSGRLGDQDARFLDIMR